MEDIRNIAIQTEQQITITWKWIVNQKETF